MTDSLAPPSGLASALAALRLDPASLEPLHEGLPEPIYRTVVDGTRAIELWEALRARVDQTGYWPVIMGDESDFERHEDLLDYFAERVAETGRSDVEETMTAALALDVPRWFSERAATYASYGTLNDLRGEWPVDESPQDSFFVAGGEGPNVLALVPCGEAWQVPAYLRWGGWNDCPAPHEQAAVLKHWAELYGAEAVAMAADQVELRVTRPPRDRAAALALAEEQFAYCTDNVTQGCGTIEALAATLVGANVWHFWWD